jgi:hypothetical protein
MKSLANEKEWVESVVGLLTRRLRIPLLSLAITSGKRLPYAHEIVEYGEGVPSKHNTVAYETDILIAEVIGEVWKPRIVIEGKLGRVSTHDAITYSEKASTHKNVHPYLRYGILLGNREHYPLPGRLFRHGAYFDFMLSWVKPDPSAPELSVMLKLIRTEIRASQDLEEILYKSRSRTRNRYTVLHRPLKLE